MKKLLVILLGVYIANFQLAAKPINVTEAKVIASSHSKFLNDKSDNLLGISEQRLIATSQEIFANSDYEIKTNLNPTFYIFANGNSNGYVIISADDIARPVLGYSNSGNFSVTDLPENFQWWLSEYDREISWAINNNITQSGETAKEWQKYRESNFGTEIQNVVVAPLIKTNWSQGAPYNNLCPYDEEFAKRTYSGCVATSVAQVMNYWKYPEQGSGSHSYIQGTNKKYGKLSASFGNTTYDWDNMTDEYNDNSTQTQNDAVATLMYHCGVALEMSYGVNGSGAYSQDIPEVMIKYFSYDSTASHASRDRVSDSEWIDLIKLELDNKRPIAYNGIDINRSSGHSFICDGYDSEDYFHFNFGWAGKGNDYFIFSAIKPKKIETGSIIGDYSYRQGAVLGIKPPQGMLAKLALYSEFIINQSTVWVDSTIKIKVNFHNIGTEKFSGTIGLALYDSLGQYVMNLGEKEVADLLPNSVFPKSIEFESKCLFGTRKGTYYLKVLYKPSIAKHWLIVKNNINLNNLVKVDVCSVANNNSIITLYSEPVVNPSRVELEQEQNFHVLASFSNLGDRTFYGNFRANIYNADNGQLIKEMYQFTEIDSLLQLSHHTVPLEFFGNVEDLALGDYLVGFQVKEKDGDWTFVNSSEYTHLKRFSVVPPRVPKDIYENNNTISSASEVTFDLFSSYIKTIYIDATLHKNDVDYYKLNLPKGNDYSITTKILDEFSDPQYDIDAVYSIKKDNSDWSESYDIEQNTPIYCIDESTLIFKISPNISGEIGKYRFKILIVKKGISAVENGKQKEEFSIVPSVAKESINIYSPLGTTPESIYIYNIAGAILYQAHDISVSTIDISAFAVGRYLVEIIADGKIYHLNFVKE